ncbi:MAG: hypothetical protein SO013_01050 [Prevotella sp.]|nr:hypothetical protein [Prevotella sp.]
MCKNLILTFSVFSSLLLTSCSKLGPLSADNFNVTPKPLETTGGKVPATIDARFPAKYMKKKAVVVVTPELRYANGQVAKGESSTFQGEKVLGNDQTVSYRLGGRYSMKTSFDYIPAMQKSDLYLTFNARMGKKKVNVPAVKVATGVIATSELYKRAMLHGGACLAPDSFQRVKTQRQEANIKFLINQANLRQSELKNNSVGEFVRMLQKINEDRERLNLQNIEVKAYASPEGGFAVNDRLANKRQDTGEGYVKEQLKKNKMDANIDANYTAEDWDGFQQLVQASNIQDKEVILRVLSMYKDPQEREQQIRNMSVTFRELATGVLPELRRARLIINYERIGRSDEQIQKQYAADPTRLSPDELLYAATLTNNDAEAMAIYQKTAELYDKDYRAFNNIGVLALKQGDEVLARASFERALSKSADAMEARANLGYLALKDGNIEAAEAEISRAFGANDLKHVLGNLDIAKGNYAIAEQHLKGYGNNSEALAQLLNKNYAGAIATLEAIKTPDATTHYLMAVVKARQGNTATAAESLRKAIQQDATLATYAANDLELSHVNK